MINVITGVALILLCLFVDLKMLKREKNLKAWLTYWSIAGIGIVLYVLYSWAFAIPSPLNYVTNWLQPITGWLNR